ncbi:hypothetical protein BC940DRAFT_98734 [Gongronella butleri]|nr:hypothetical protein BC940DRAFT_98734 [Gongronella butleri]
MARIWVSLPWSSGFLSLFFFLSYNTPCLSGAAPIIVKMSIFWIHHLQNDSTDLLWLSMARAHAEKTRRNGLLLYDIIGHNRFWEEDVVKTSNSIIIFFLQYCTCISN